MIGQHPDLYGLPELRLFRAATVDALLRDSPRGAGIPWRERLAGLLRALAQVHDGDQSERSVEAALRWLEARRNWPTVSIFDYLQQQIAPRIAVEKSPETSLSDTALSRVMQAYPMARFLHLTRHPWATVNSMVGAWSGLEYWRVSASEAHDFCARLWLEQHQRICRVLAPLRPGRYFRARAEDVVDRGANLAPAICSWLELSDAPDSLEAMWSPERSVFARPGPAGAWGGFDPKFLRSPSLRAVKAPPGLTPPPSWGVRPHVEEAVKLLARRFGYGDLDGRLVTPVSGWRSARRRTRIGKNGPWPR